MKDRVLLHLQQTVTDQDHPNDQTHRTLGKMSASHDIDVVNHLRWLAMREMRWTTQYNRQRALGRLGDWAGGRRLLELSYADLGQWQAVRRTQLAPGSRRAELSHAREFYRWAIREELRDDDPTLRIPMPRAPRRLPRPMSEEDFRTGLATIDARAAVAIALAGYAGLRCMEIAQLDWSEIDLTGPIGEMRIIDGKGGVGRILYVSPPLAVALRMIPPPHRGPVLKRLDGGRGYNASWRISQLGNRALHDLGVEETMHQLRHRFATVAYQGEPDIRAVQELLGHASPATTAIYTKPGAGARLRAVMAASGTSDAA